MAKLVQDLMKLLIGLVGICIDSALSFKFII